MPLLASKQNAPNATLAYRFQNNDGVSVTLVMEIRVLADGILRVFLGNIVNGQTKQAEIAKLNLPAKTKEVIIPGRNGTSQAPKTKCLLDPGFSAEDPPRPMGLGQRPPRNCKSRGSGR